MSTELVEGNVLQLIRELNERLNRIERKEVRANELSEIASDAGLIEAGELRVHADWNDPHEPGEGFSGVRILGTFEYGGKNYAIVGVNNDAMTFGLSSEDGSALFCSGNAVIDADGITGTDLLKWLVKQTATNSTHTRTGKLGMALEEGGGTIPAWQLSYESPAGVELVTNGDFETGDLSNWTSTTDINGAWSADNTVKKSGSYSAKWTPTADGDGNTKALLHFDGTDTSTTITDESGKTWTANNGAQLKTAQKKFGTASCFFDGTNDYISTPDHDDWNLGSGNFTVEAWIRPADIANRFVLGQGSDGVSTRSFYITIGSDGAIGATLASGSTEYVLNTETSFYSADTWYHVALVRNGNVFSLYVDGVLVDSITLSITLNNASTALSIGRFGDQAVFYYSGYIDEFRFTKGVARHTANYTPEVAAYEDIISKGILTSDRVAVGGIKNYGISADIRSSVNAGTIKAEVKWYDHVSAGSLLRTDIIGTSNTTGAFTNFEISPRSPSGALSCAIVLTCDSSQTSRVYFDDISVSESSVSTKLQLTDRGVETSNGLYPESATMFWDEAKSATALASAVDTSQMYNMLTAPNTNGAEFVFKRLLRSGTYDLNNLGRRNTDNGKFDISINGNMVISGEDWYGASAYNHLKRTSNILIPKNGLQEILFKVNGKNASSSAYYARMTKSWFVRTGNIPNYEYADDILSFAKLLASWDNAVPTEYDGFAEINGVNLGAFGYSIFSGETISAFDSANYFTTIEDASSAWVIWKGNLTINAGQTILPAKRKLFTVLYVKGDLTINGGISMTARGSNHRGDGISGGAVTAAAIRIATGTFSTVVNPQVPATGAAGGAAVSGSDKPGSNGSNGTGGQTGGGGSGGRKGAGATGGAGTDGTGFSGGAGGGGGRGATGEAGQANGGKGGNGNASVGNKAGGGAGNPGGAFSRGGANGEDGTGGILMVICTGELIGAGTIAANGMNGGNVTGDHAGGGGSGGGSVTILYGTDGSSITPTATGGAGGTATTSAGGAGGNGTARKLAL